MYRNIKELNYNELLEVKENYAINVKNMNLSFSEILAINEIITDKEVFDFYKDTNFTNDDFCWNV